MSNTIYNQGEQLLQKRFGEQKMAAQVEKAVKNNIVPGAIAFIQNQPMVVISTTDANGNIWVSMLINNFGFAKIAGPEKLILSIEKLRTSKEDVLFENIKTPTKVGSIFIELGSRRRFRINGKATLKEGRISLEVNEAYPNCPKYIQRRVLQLPKERIALQTEITKGEVLTKKHEFWINNTDTLFVGSQGKDGKMDASHRGGNYGFIEILPNGLLKIPDYTGNSMYNTLGNFVENSNAGLLFFNFKANKVLQLSGKASLLFDQQEENDLKKTTNTGRYWIFETKHWIETTNFSDATWNYEDASTFNPDLSGV